MIKIEITAENVKDLFRQLHFLLEGNGIPEITGAQEASFRINPDITGFKKEEDVTNTATKKSRATKGNVESRFEVKPIPPQAEDEGVNGETNTPEPGGNEEPEITIDTLRAAILSKPGMKDKVKDILGKFGAERLGDVKTEKYPELLAELNKI